MKIYVRNVNDAPQEMFYKLKGLYLREETRNGEVVRFTEPVSTIYSHPTERVLFWPERDANPFFHLMEAIWILAGRRDVEFPALFNSNISNYSDDGEVFNAAYGYRIREHFGVDQLLGVVPLLRKDPTTRQAIIQIWSTEDLLKDTKDKACNMQLIFDTTEGKLNMTVVNRSNDAIWGAYGANAVHFSFIHEFVSTAADIPMGIYRQQSHNLHVYTKLYGSHLDVEHMLEVPPPTSDYNEYKIAKLNVQRLIKPGENYEQFLTYCDDFCNAVLNRDYYPDLTFGGLHFSKSGFLNFTAWPMAIAYLHYKDGDIRTAYHLIENTYKISQQDWHLAGCLWLHRRIK